MTESSLPVTDPSRSLVTLERDASHTTGAEGERKIKLKKRFLNALMTQKIHQNASSILLNV